MNNLSVTLYLEVSCYLRSLLATQEFLPFLWNLYVVKRMQSRLQPVFPRSVLILSFYLRLDIRRELLI
jgi:hypothetical protein